MITNSVKNDLLVLNSAEKRVSKIQDLIEKLRKLTLINSATEIRKINDECIREITLLPIVEEFRPSLSPFEFNLNGSPSTASLDDQIDEVQSILSEYSFRISKKRKELAPLLLLDIFEEVEDLLARLKTIYLGKDLRKSQKIEDSSLPKLIDKISEIAICLGENMHPLKRWEDLNRHLAFGEIHDLEDVVSRDWPSVKRDILADFLGLRGVTFSGDESVDDLRKLLKSEAARNKFNWKNIDSEEFERLIFQIFSEPDVTYENVEFLMKTNAPDCGRDISAYRVHRDSFSGTIRYRAIIQCKHWLNKSLSVRDISYLKDQIKLWEPPRVDILIIATTGHFSSDAVKFMESHNQSSSALRIEFWPIETIKRIIDFRPHLLSRFKI